MARKKHVLDRVIRARSSLLLDHPFYAAIALKLKMDVDEDGTQVPTMGTDGVRIVVNPEWVEKLSDEEIKGVIVHEIWHVISKHTLRREERQPTIWNLACDIAINQHIESAGFALPKEGLHLNNVKNLKLDLDDCRGREAEYVYAKILEKNDMKQLGISLDGDGGGNGDQKIPVDLGGCGVVMDHPAKKQGKAAMKEAEHETNMTIQQAHAAAKMQGKVPAEVQRMLDELRNPRLPWREILARFITTVAKNDYSWKLPHRRYIQQGFYMPSLYSQEVGRICLFVDTSGSIDNEELTEFASEIQGILSMFPGLELLVVYCDAAVAGHQVITANDVPVSLTPAGGGGTDFRPPFDWIDEEGIEPLCIIYYTDGYCSSFPDSSPCPVLWTLSSNTHHDKTNWEPPLGEVLKIYQ